MKKTLLLKTMFLLFAMIAGSSSAWADYEEVYNLNCPKNSKNSAYANYFDITVNGINWNAPGNQNIDGCWRIGGKSLSNVDRVITGESAINEQITKISFNHKGKSRNDVTVASVTLTVASDADFNTLVDEIVVENPDITKNTANSIEFTPTSPLTKWDNCYYKITISVSNSSDNNGGLDVTSIVFYKTIASKTATTTTISDANLTSADLKNGTAAGALSASVTAGDNPVAGATVSWESSKPEVATIDDAGTVTLVAVGTTTITATYAGNNDYYGSSKTYELTVTDTRTATVTNIDATGLTNTDIYASTIGGQLTASVTAGESPVLGATVTWDSSDPEVATIDDAGNVTLVKAGTTTITATYAGGGSYAASSKTYELTVIDSNAPLLYESVSKYSSESDSSTKITSENASTYLDAVDKWDYDNFSNVYPGKNGCFKLGASGKSGILVTNAISMLGSGKLTFKAKQYKSGEDAIEVTVTGATASGDVSVEAGSDFAEYTVYLNNATGSVVITFATESKRMYLDEIKLVKVEKVNVVIPAGKEWITFCSPYKLDFTNAIDGLEGAYSITAHASGATTLTATKLTGKVLAETGLLLRAAEKKTTDQAITIPVADSGSMAVGNMLKGVIVDTEVQKTESTNTNLGLSNGEFHPYGEAGILAAGKAYLQIPTAQMPTGGNNAKLIIVFDGEATGIDNLNLNDNDNFDANAPMYNLAGQRVNKSYKGVVIVNGKKVVRK